MALYSYAYSVRCIADFVEFFFFRFANLHFKHLIRTKYPDKQNVNELIIYEIEIEIEIEPK